MAQPTHTGTEASGHGAQGGFPPFASETYPSQLLWVALTFGALYFLMSRVALPRVEKVLHSRKERISGDLAEAQRLRAEAEAAEEAYNTALHQARSNAQAIAQKTKDELSAEFDVRRKALEADLNSKLAEAEATIRSGTEAAMGNVRSIAADAASAIVERLIGTKPAPATVEAALDRAA